MIVVVLLIAVVLYRPATSQDNYEERISSLETRVAVLEGAPADEDNQPAACARTHVHLDGGARKG